MKKSEVYAIAAQLKSKKILVFGDVILDCYKYGNVNRLSPEADVPVFAEERTGYGLGGAANVANNLIACNQQVILVSVTGNDENSAILREELQKSGIGDGFVVADGGRKTTVKTRYYNGKKTQLLRVDCEDTFDVNAAVEQALLDNILSAIECCAAVVISDYAKGAVTERLIKATVKAAREKSIKVLVDPKTAPFEKYSGCDVLKPNLSEFAKIAGKAFNPDTARNDCTRICGDFDCKSIVVTCGDKGLFYCENNGNCGNISADEVTLGDVSGAGDTVSAYLIAALANGFNLQKAALIANFAAGLKVAKVGAVPVSLFDIIRSTDKIIEESRLAALREEYKDKRIVFTNGCFDILHAGHAENLETAAGFGDILVVAVNSDSSVKSLKGAGRPVFGLENRLKMLAALKCVDFVVAFDAPTPIEIIRAVEPDVLVKGGDYAESEVVGADFVKKRGGEVKIVPLTEGLSTTRVISAIKKDGN